MLENTQPSYAELQQSINQQRHCGTDCNHDHQVNTYVRESAKIGRNDPCVCGSNKKYKKCCGSNN